MKKNEVWYEKRECYNCDGIMHRHMTKIAGFKARGWKCNKCGEGIILGEDAQRALILNQLKKGVPVKIGKLGNNHIIRIPKKVYDFFELKDKKEISISVQLSKGKAKIILEF